MIRFANVSKAYLGGKPALQGLSFHLPVGSMTYLVGRREEYLAEINYGYGARQRRAYLV